MRSQFLIACFLGLNAAFIWARFVVFRFDEPPRRSVRVIEISTLLCIAFGTSFIAMRGFTPVWVDAAALGTSCASAAMFIWATLSVRRGQLTAAFSGDRPTELLSKGAFGFVRNPFYLAYLIAHAVPFVASRSPWAVLPIFFMGTIYHQAARAEERKFQSSTLAAEWSCYAKRTGRFLPRPMVRGKRREDLQ